MNTREGTILLTNRTHTGFAVSVITALILTAIGEMSASGVPEDNAPKPAPPYAQSSTVDYDSDAAFIQRMSAPAPKIAPGEKSQEGFDDYDKANSLNPKDVWTYIMRGGACAELGQYQKAIDLCSQVIDLDPHNILAKALAYVQRGNAYLSLGLAHNDPQQYQKAIEDLTAAINLGVDNKLASLAYRARASVLYEGLKQYQKAAEDYTRAISLSPQNASPYVYRAQSYEKLGQYQNAIADFDKAISINSKDGTDSWALGSKGDLYLKQKQWHKAIDAYTKVLKSDFSNVEADTANARKYCAYDSRSKAYRELRLHEKGINDFCKAQPLYDRTSKDSLEITRKLREVNEYVYFSYAIREHPKEAWPYAGRGNVQLKRGLHKEAVEDCSLAIGLDPKCADAFVTRGFAYRTLKQHPKAVEDFKKAVSLNPSLASKIALR